MLKFGINQPIVIELSDISLPVYRFIYRQDR